MERHQNEVSRSTRRQLEHRYFQVKNCFCYSSHCVISSARMIRQEQDLEYQEALARDREQVLLRFKFRVAVIV